MKKYFYLCALFLSCTLGFTACSEDEEITQIEPTVHMPANMYELSDRFDEVYYESYCARYRDIFTFKFDENNLCISAKLTQVIYESENESASPIIVTQDLTNIFKGWTRKAVKGFVARTIKASGQIPPDSWIED